MRRLMLSFNASIEGRYHRGSDVSYRCFAHSDAAGGHDHRIRPTAASAESRPMTIWLSPVGRILRASLVARPGRGPKIRTMPEWLGAKRQLLHSAGSNAVTRQLPFGNDAKCIVKDGSSIDRDSSEPDDHLSVLSATKRTSGSKPRRAHP